MKYLSYAFAFTLLMSASSFSEGSVSNTSEIRLEDHADFFWRDLVKKGIDKIKTKFGRGIQEAVESDAAVDCTKLRSSTSQQDAMDFSSFVQAEYCNKGYQDECTHMLKKAGDFMNCFR